jgi:predicted GTPase
MFSFELKQIELSQIYKREIENKIESLKDEKVKILIIGNAGAGKTSLINRLLLSQNEIPHNAMTLPGRVGEGAHTTLKVHEFSFGNPSIIPIYRNGSIG